MADFYSSYSIKTKAMSDSDDTNYYIGQPLNSKY